MIIGHRITREEYNTRQHRWRRWFAWHPVWIGKELHWLRYVWRRGDVSYPSMVGGDTGGIYTQWEYSLDRPEEECEPPGFYRHQCINRFGIEE